MTEMKPRRYGPLIPTVGRADVIIRRGITERWGVLLEQRDSVDDPFRPRGVEEGDESVVTLRGIDGSMWLQKGCHIDPVRSLVVAQIDPGDLAVNPAVWRSRQAGTWSIDLNDRRLADGYFTLEV